MTQRTLLSTFVVGQSETPVALLNENSLSGIIVTGSSITGTKITFLVSNDNTTFYPLYNSTSEEVSITTTTSARAYSLEPKDFLPWLYVKARLGTSASAVLQATIDQSVELIMENF